MSKMENMKTSLLAILWRSVRVRLGEVTPQSRCRHPEESRLISLAFCGSEQLINQKRINLKSNSNSNSNSISISIWFTKNSILNKLINSNSNCNSFSFQTYFNFLSKTICPLSSCGAGWEISMLSKMAAQELRDLL